MDVTRLLANQFPPWMAIPLAFAITLAAVIAPAAVIALVRHLAHRTEHDWMLAEHRAWTAAHPVAPQLPPDLGRLTVRPRSRQVPAPDPAGDGQATPSSPESSGDGVASPAAADRVGYPECARSAAPSARSAA